MTVKTIVSLETTATADTALPVETTVTVRDYGDSGLLKVEATVKIYSTVAVETTETVETTLTVENTVTVETTAIAVTAVKVETNVIILDCCDSRQYGDSSYH